MQPPAFARRLAGMLRSRPRYSLLQCCFAATLLLGSGDGRAAIAEPLTTEPKLVRTPLRIVPTAGQLATLPRYPAEWHLSAPLVSQFATFIATARFSPELVAELKSRLRVLPDGTGLIRPDAALLDRFLPVERMKWMLLLGLHADNVTYRWPVAVRPEIVDRLAATPEHRDAAERFRRWSSLYKGRLTSGDLFALEDAFSSEVNRQAFYRELLGSTILMVRLSDSEVDEAGLDAHLNYWQANGRYRAIEPFLATLGMIEEVTRIDLAHLLPLMARQTLHTYPQKFDATEDLAIDVGTLMAGLFASRSAEDLQPGEAFSEWLERECVQIDGPRQFGDIVVYVDTVRTRWPFVAVYIADQIVFTRRPTLHGPWEFLVADEIPGLNPRLNATKAQYYRRKSALGGPGRAPFRRGEMPAAWREHLKLRPLAEGPWGRLWCYEVLLAPAGAVLESLQSPSQEPLWTFENIEPAELVAAIEPIAMPAATKDALRTLFGAATRDALGRVSTRPTMDLVLATPREVRARIFPHLITGNTVRDYAQPIRLPTRTPASEWFSPEVLPVPQREQMLQLVYRQGQGLSFADYGALYHLFTNPRDRLTALRALLRTPALVVLLERPKAGEARALGDYWRFTGSKDIPKFLEAFAAAEDMQYLDVLHLLPPNARPLLNFYGAPSVDEPTPSCYWTALNFFAEEPDNRFLVLPTNGRPQADLAGRYLRDNYERIEQPSQFGDVIAYYRRSDETIIHVCSYIAADVVYTKNGFSFLAPWCLTHLADVDGQYADTGKIDRQVFRLRGAPAQSTPAPAAR